MIDVTKDFISGEKITGLCDVALYERNYLNKYNNLNPYCKQTMFINEDIRRREIDIIESSYSFFLKPDWIPFIILYHIKSNT